MEYTQNFLFMRSSIKFGHKLSMKEILNQNKEIPTSNISLLLDGFAIACLPFLIEFWAILFFPFYFDKYQFPIASLVGKTAVLFFKNFNWVLIFTAIQFFILKRENLSKAFLPIFLSALLSGVIIAFLSYYQMIENFASVFYGDKEWNAQMIFWHGAFWGARVITIVFFCFLLLQKGVYEVKRHS